MTGDALEPDICGCCCASAPRREVGRAESRERPVAASDAVWLRDVSVRRLLCANCGALEVLYEPADALARHFARDYDLEAAVQNNLVVAGGRVARKKSLIDDRLDRWIEAWPAPIGGALEVACGRGELISRLAAAHPHWRCVSVDPSPDLAAAESSASGRPELIQSFFSADQFEGEKFGAVIAHGFLNRSPTIRELKAIRSLCREDALMSIEVLLLDTSPHCPAIWDHSYMFSRRSFMRWLAAIGFDVLDVADNASSWHVIARAAEPNDPTSFLAEGEPEYSAKLYARFEDWWARATADVIDVAENVAGTPFALFGAGMFTAGLLSRAPALRPDYILDDLKAGREMFDIPVVAVDAAAPGAMVALFTRPAYARAVENRLTGRGHAVKRIPGADMLGRAPLIRSGAA